MSPIYYVTFTTAVLTASFVLFQGFHITDLLQTTLLLCGFLVIFLGIYMLNFPSKDLDSPEFELLTGGSTPGSPGIVNTTFSLQGLRPSSDMERQTQLYEEDDGYILQSLVRRSQETGAVD